MANESEGLEGRATCGSDLLVGTNRRDRKCGEAVSIALPFLVLCIAAVVVPAWIG